MKKNGIRALMLLAYSIPSVLIVMYLDITYHVSFIFYGLCLFTHGLLCRSALKSQIPLCAILGNVSGLYTNYACWQLCQTEHWNAYFKWLPSSGFMFSILGISFAVQLWFLVNDYTKRKWAK